MSARWRSGYEPAVLLKELEKSRIRAADGQVSFQGFALTPYSAALTTMLDLGALPDTEAHRVVNQAIWNAAKADSLNCSRILTEADALIAGYFKQPLTEYHLVTSLSFSSRARPPCITFNGRRLRFTGSFRRYRETRLKAIEE